MIKSVEQISRVITLASEIAQASNPQARNIQQVNGGLSPIDSVTQQNALSAEETAGATQKLTAHTHQLHTVISQHQPDEPKAST